MIPARPLILLIGPNGQLGHELRRTLAPLGEVTCAGRSGADCPLDLMQPGALAALLDELRPALVVNAAAHTAVDRAEHEPEAARRLNAGAVDELGRAAADIGCPVVHFSTDYVFSGDIRRPLNEQDPPAPRSVYGRTKLEGERRLAASGADHLLLRTAWVYGARGHNFLLTMRRLMQQRDTLQIVDDQHGAPTWSRHIAEACGQVLAQCRVPGGFAFGKRGGLYHLTAAGHTTWYGFARAIRDGLGLSCRLQSIASADYPAAAPRPAWSVLDSSRLWRRFGVALPHWQVGLAQCLACLEPGA